MVDSFNVNNIELINFNGAPLTPSLLLPLFLSPSPSPSLSPQV